MGIGENDRARRVAARPQELSADWRGSSPVRTSCWWRAGPVDVSDPAQAAESIYWAGTAIARIEVPRRHWASQRCEPRAFPDRLGAHRAAVTFIVSDSSSGPRLETVRRGPQTITSPGAGAVLPFRGSAGSVGSSR